MLNNLLQMHLKLLHEGLLKKRCEKNSCGGRITKPQKNSQQNNSEIVTIKNDKEIPKERYIPPEERQRIIDNCDISRIL